ncbi:MAG: hypothetical protein WKF59_23860 [Chitinophagaceae bacterium]
MNRSLINVLVGSFGGNSNSASATGERIRVIIKKFL